MTESGKRIGLAFSGGGYRAAAYHIGVLRTLHRLGVLDKVDVISGNHEAAENMAVVCSLLATCRNHNVNPRDYLNDVISQMPYHTKASHEQLLQLLPHKWKLMHPESVVTKTT